MDKSFLDMIGKVTNETMDGVLEYVSPQSGPYEQMPQYEKDEMIARGVKVLEAVAAYYDFVGVEQMLAILEMNRGKR